MIDKRLTMALKKLNKDKRVLDFRFGKEEIPIDSFKKTGDYIVAFSTPIKFEETFSLSVGLADFLKNFMDYNDKYRTVEINTGKYVCDIGRRRSLIDIFLITRSYFPRVGLRTVIKAMLGNPKISTNVCQMTRRRVYYIRKGESQRHAQKEIADEFKHNIESWKDIITNGE